MPSFRIPPSDPVTRSLRLGLIALGCGLASGGVLAQSFPAYTLQPLQLTAYAAFNDQGLILGRAFPPCPPGQFCALSDAPALLDTVQGTVTIVSSDFGALNGKGQLAGASNQTDATGQVQRSIILRNPDGSLSSGPPPAVPQSLTYPLKVRGLTNTGIMAVQLSDGLDAALARSCTPYPGWLGSTSGVWTALGGGALSVSLAAVNSAGRVVGAGVPVAACATRDFHALVASPSGSWVDLHGNHPGPSSRALAINDRDYAVGEISIGTTDINGQPISHAMVWNTRNSVAFDLSPGDGISSRLNGINDRGEVVGRTGVGASARAVIGNHAISSSLFDLTSLVWNNTEGWALTEALAVNGAGQVVARGGTPANGEGYVLLTPTQPPFDPYAVAPAAPLELVAEALSSSQIALRWTNLARNATGLDVERCKGVKCTSFALIASLAGDVATFVDKTLKRSTAYRYRVRATNPAGPSAYAIQAGTTWTLK